MNKARITLLGSHNDLLVNFLESHPQGHERAAVVLFRKISRTVEGLPDSDRFISHDVILFPEKWITDSSPIHVDFVKLPLRDFYRRCEEEDLIFGFIHNHPNGADRFSARDNDNEISLLSGIVNRNGPETSLVAMVRVNNRWIARVRDGRDLENVQAARHTTVLTEFMNIHCPEILDDQTDQILARQSAAFGKPFSAKLNSLRVVVVGAGGTGSPVISLLARSGIGEIISIDYDSFETSNLNRVRGSRSSDNKKNKAEIQRDFINELGLECKITAINGSVNEDYNAMAALSTADVIFGCTDDWAGRDVLNTAVYFYGVPLIDLGLGGVVDKGDDGQPYLRNHSGRISCVMPEAGRCLFCQGVVRQEWIDYQLAEKADPERAAQDAQEGYLVNGGEVAPGVGPFTGMTADWAVATLFNMIKRYRHDNTELLWDCIYIDFVSMRIRSVQTKDNTECEFCQKRRFLLNREKSYLLGRPVLRPQDFGIQE